MLPTDVEEIHIATVSGQFTRELGTNVTLPCVTRHAGGTVVSWARGERVLTADNVKAATLAHSFYD